MTFLPFIGVERNGARRWIKLPLLGTFQPSEIAKFTMIVLFAKLTLDYGKKVRQFRRGVLGFGGTVKSKKEEDKTLL